MNLNSRLQRSSVRRLTRLAAMLALTGLAIMAYAVVSPRPLPVILAMSVGQVIGIAAFFCYLVAVVLDVSRSKPAPDSLNPPPPSTAPPPGPQPPPPPSRRAGPPPPPR
jgi:Na+/melibiose symporter-like transporter